MRPILAAEAEASLEAVRLSLGGVGHRDAIIGRPQPSGVSDGPGIEAAGSPGYLTLAQGAAMLLDELRLLAPATTGTSPAAAVKAYYCALGDALGGIDPHLRGLRQCCCGAALRNLERNLPGMPVGTDFHLVSLDVSETNIEGHLATVRVNRTADFRYGTSVTRDTSGDCFRLRLRPAGWSVFH